MSILRNTFLVCALATNITSLFANDLVGIWKSLEEKDDPTTSILAYDEDGTFDISSADPMSIKCDQFKLDNVNQLKSIPRIDEILVCQSSVDNDYGIFTVRYDKTDKRVIDFQILGRSSELNIEKISNYPTEYSYILEAINKAQVNKPFTLTDADSSEDGAFECVKIKESKIVNNNKWNAPDTIFCVNHKLKTINFLGLDNEKGLMYGISGFFEGIDNFNANLIRIDQ